QEHVEIEGREACGPGDGFGGEHGERQWKTRDVGLVPVFTFVNNAMAAITLTEVNGVVAVKGNFIEPPNAWATSDVPAQSLLKVQTEVLPALNLGQGAVNRLIVEVNRGVMSDGWSRDRVCAAAEQWGWLFNDELQRKWETRFEDAQVAKLF